MAPGISEVLQAYVFKCNQKNNKQYHNKRSIKRLRTHTRDMQLTNRLNLNKLKEK